jgi:hypothetical protein
MAPRYSRPYKEIPMRSEIHPTPQQMMNDIRERPTVPVWPHAGWAHGFKSKGGAYAAARRGEIATATAANLSFTKHPRRQSADDISKLLRSR